MFWFLHFPSPASPAHPKPPISLIPDSGEVILEVRSSDAALYHSLSWTNSSS